MLKQLLPCVQSKKYLQPYSNKFYLGCDEYVEVNDSVKTITDYLKVNPELTYTGGNKGWVGDNPFIYLDTRKIRNLGWKEKVSINEGILKTIEWLDQNLWVYKST